VLLQPKNLNASLRTGFEKMEYNVWWLGEGCLTDAQFSHKFQWQLLPNRCYLLGGLSAET
jgi:hypothetical protein